jgi:putative hydrolase of the HAD superfamily
MKTIIFDMYGVIIKESKGNFIPYIYSHFPNTERSLILNGFGKAQRGEIDSDEFISSFGFTNPDIIKKDYIENHLTIDTGFYTFANKFKGKYDFALLSNDVSEWSRYITEYYKLDDYFKVKVISADVHCKKPEKEIYEVILQKLNIPANCCIYIDNSVKNLLTAREIGMDIVLFNRDGESYDGKTVYSFDELEKLMECKNSVYSVTESDLPACLDVIHLGFETVAIEYGLTEENCPHRGGASLPYEALYDEFKNNVLMYCYKVDDKIVGFISLVKKSDYLYKIKYLVLLPEYRHNGYGKELLDFIRNKVIESGGNTITLGMNNDNNCLKNWYIANGFTNIGTAVYPGLPFTVGYMEMKL